MIGLKFIVYTVLSVLTPYPDFEYENNLGECGGINSVPFSYIECVGVSNNNADNSALLEYLAQYAEWPITEDRVGILIRGYE
tara:strand:- start:959 stop:1204 length:246 start_codon:yes stop_codon:yes gene_type:complete